MNTDLATRARFAGELARSAGTLARRYFRREIAFTREAKGLQDWVSEADRDVESTIRGAIARAYPGESMFGEEEGGDIGDRTWFVDPIDGTLNFVHGVRYWCVSIAFVERGERKVGAIYDPELDELFVAVRGGGARCNGDPIAVSQCSSLGESLIVNGHVPRHEMEAHLRLRRSLLAAGCAVKDMGAGALMLAHVAAGRYDAFIEPHMNPWDALAGLLLVEEAGGRTRPYPAAGLAAGGPVVAAATGVFDALTRMTDA